MKNEKIVVSVHLQIHEWSSKERSAKKPSRNAFPHLHRNLQPINNFNDSEQLQTVAEESRRFNLQL